MGMDTATCPFCLETGLLKGEIIHQTEKAYLIKNTFHPGNFLIIPLAHITEVQMLPDDWWSDVKKLLASIPELSADFNLSLNIGQLAGQTQSHLHLWVIPRTANPVAPGKGMVGLMQLVQDNRL